MDNGRPHPYSQRKPTRSRYEAEMWEKVVDRFLGFLTPANREPLRAHTSDGNAKPHHGVPAL